MADTQWPVYEVFLQEKRGDPHVHVGAVHAPDPEMALILAKEQFARRGRCASLWVVPAEAIYASRAEEAEELFASALEKEYREPRGFRVTERVRRWMEGHGQSLPEAE
jgi:ring-1,2-phenylacetyl-CoA epoxidase subunit PaaB